MDYEKERKSVSSQKREMQVYGKIWEEIHVWKKEASWWKWNM